MSKNTKQTSKKTKQQIINTLGDLALGCLLLWFGLWASGYMQDKRAKLFETLETQKTMIETQEKVLGVSDIALSQCLYIVTSEYMQNEALGRCQYIVDNDYMRVNQVESQKLIRLQKIAIGIQKELLNKSNQALRNCRFMKRLIKD